MRTKILFLIVPIIFVLSGCASTVEKNTSRISGTTAHDFTLSDQNGKLWKLSDALKDYQAVVIAFYPKDDTKL